MPKNLPENWINGTLKTLDVYEHLGFKPVRVGLRVKRTKVQKQRIFFVVGCPQKRRTYGSIKISDFLITQLLILKILMKLECSLSHG